MVAMSTVQVIDPEGKPLNRCHPARARELLKKQRAEVVSRTPYTIRLISTADPASRAAPDPQENP